MIERPTPMTTDGWVRQGISALTQGQHAAALECFAGALKADPLHAVALINNAGLLASQGRYEEALNCLGRVAPGHPLQAEALASAGHVLRCLGRVPEALECLERAFAIKPRHPGVLLNRGLTLSDLGRWEAAAEALSAAVAEAPGNAEALHGLARALVQLDRTAEALLLAERALSISPRHLGALSVRAYVLALEERHEEALSSLEQVLELAPDNVEALSSKGHSLLALGQTQDACRVLERARQLAPDHAGVLENHAIALRRLGYNAHALQCLDRLLRIDPQRPSALFDRASVLRSMCRQAEALEALKRLTASDRDAPRALRLGAQILIELDRCNDAVACLDRLLAQEPDDVEAAVLRAMSLEGTGRRPEAAAALVGPRMSTSHQVGFYTNRGCLLMEIFARRQEALECFDHACRLDPSCMVARLNRSFALLALGRLEEGWREMECRWSIPKALTSGVASSAPLWLGEQPLSGKTVLIDAEQGYGDTLQFVRYVPELQRRGAQVIVRVKQALHRLLASLPGRPQLVSDSEAPPPHDLRCPSMSLPLAFGTTLESIPAPIPYLAADPVSVEAWRRRLGERTRPRVGLVWAGRQYPPVNYRRDMPLASLQPLLELPVDFVGLQQQIPLEDRSTLKFFPEPIRVGASLTDFADAAALIANLDLLITVDTSVLHLAGALGKAVWVMNRFAPCWRWLEARSDSPWYPSARLFRQPSPGDWRGVVMQVKDALSGWLVAR